MNAVNNKIIPSKPIYFIPPSKKKKSDNNTEELKTDDFVALIVKEIDEKVSRK